MRNSASDVILSKTKDLGNPESSAELLCYRCEYDLRAHPPDGRCPECGEPVAESRRMAAIPRRPAWRDSDPRWQRRILAGVWVLVLLPLMDAMKAFGWASSVPVPAVFDFRGAVRTLNDTLVSDSSLVYQPLVFCIGVVLLFSKERERRRNQLDWTRRWGILCSYIVLLLSAAQFLFIAALVLAGISALFLSMPAIDQPVVTQLFVHLSTAYLRYGPYPREIFGVVLVAFSSIAILLTCIPLFDALRSSGSQRLAAILVAPLVSLSLLHLAQAGLYCLGFSSAEDVADYWLYFQPALVARSIYIGATYLNLPGPMLGAYPVEVTKWCAVLAIAVWLSIAQLTALWQRKKTSAG